MRWTFELISRAFLRSLSAREYWGSILAVDAGKDVL